MRSWERKARRDGWRCKAEGFAIAGMIMATKAHIIEKRQRVPSREVSGENPGRAVKTLEWKRGR